jgi:hypothetical protein
MLSSLLVVISGFFHDAIAEIAHAPYSLWWPLQHFYSHWQASGSLGGEASPLQDLPRP